ncbi:hypothetical protein ACU4GI_20275 [Cupriavidus basilensis]
MDSLFEELTTSPQAEIPRLLELASDEQLKQTITDHAPELADVVLSGVDQKLAARIISILPADLMRDLLIRANSDVLSRFLRVAQVSQLSKTIQNARNELIERLIEAAPSSRTRNAIAKELPIDRRKDWVERIRSMESEVDRTRSLSADATSSLFEERKRLLVELEDAIRVKEEMLRSVERESHFKNSQFQDRISDAEKRLAILNSTVAARQSEMEERERDLAARQAEFDEANRRQVQERIELKVPQYVAAAVSVLEEREVLYRKKASHWSLQGITVLSVAILAAVVISLFGSGFGVSLNAMSWQTLLFVSFKGLVVLSVLGLWAKHAFTVSNAYMHEAIKRSDRAHAINFGKLYLEIYGNSVDRKELINIFENWNIASESAFAKANPSGFEPQIVEKLETALKLFEKAKSGAS